jgi:hypothetical protein
MPASPPRTGWEVVMWNEWLVRTLKSRRDGASARRARRPVFAAPPDFEGDGMHPGADDFRSAVGQVKAEAPSD